MQWNHIVHCYVGCVVRQSDLPKRTAKFKKYVVQFFEEHMSMADCKMGVFFHN